MVQINFAQKSVTVKIVYYGPGMSGKTTNLEIIHQRAPDTSRGELTSISTDGDRTLFFDFMPLDLGTVAGMRTQFQIYTVPGQVYYNSTRKLVLQGVDGVIFVADSSASMVEENLESLRNLRENLADYGKDLDELPLVIQYNKRDLPDAMSVKELDQLLNPSGLPSFEAVANSGQGVFPTLKALAAKVLESVHRTSGEAPPVGETTGSPVPTSPAPSPEAPAAPAPVAPTPMATNFAPSGGPEAVPSTSSTSFSEPTAPAVPPAPTLEPVGSAPQAPEVAPTMGSAHEAPGLQMASSGMGATDSQPSMNEVPNAAPLPPSLGMASAPSAPSTSPGVQEQGPSSGLALASQPAPAMQEPSTAHETSMGAASPRAAMMHVDPAAAPAVEPERRSASLPAASSPRIRPRQMVAPTPMRRRSSKGTVMTIAVIAGAMAVGVALGGLLFQVL